MKTKQLKHQNNIINKNIKKEKRSTVERTPILSSISYLFIYFLNYSMCSQLQLKPNNY